MPATPNERPIIIKRIKKAGHAHHGGSWKVAYADFVTAMMAFFMLLWLLNVTTDEQKKGIADYFSPASISKSSSGSGGILGGKTLITEGSKISDTGVPSVAMALNPPTTPSDHETQDNFKPEQQAEGGADQEALERAKADQAEIERALAEREEKAFQNAIDQLQKAIQDVPALAELGKHLLVEMTPEGLRIQLIDQDHESMFPTGSAQMVDFTRAILQRIAQVIAKLPNKIAISGHTDATPYRTDNGYSNWELSTDRANASRRVLLEGGLNPRRIAQVVGKADTEPLKPEEPYHATNRRISIVLLREQKLTDAAGAVPTGATPGALPQTIPVTGTPPKAPDSNAAPLTPPANSAPTPATESAPTTPAHGTPVQAAPANSLPTPATGPVAPKTKPAQ